MPRHVWCVQTPPRLKEQTGRGWYCGTPAVTLDGVCVAHISQLWWIQTNRHSRIQFNSVKQNHEFESFGFKAAYGTTLKKFKIDELKVCLSVGAFSLASDSSETIGVIIINLGMVTASW